MKKLMMTIGAVLMTAGALADGESFAYQGLLCDDKGAPIRSQTKTVAFRLYPAATDGTKLWGREIPVRTDANGLFSVELSDTQGRVETDVSTKTLTTAYAATTKMGKPLYIALAVEGSSGEIRPRQKLSATPMASFARDVKSISDTFMVKGQATFSGGVDVTGDIYNVMPTNTIALWYGTRESVPQGWRICDGRYGTPNMFGKFPVGARKDADDKTDEYAVDKTGGAEQVTLSVDQMPSHSHGFKYPMRYVSIEGERKYGVPSHNLTDGTKKLDLNDWEDYSKWGNFGGKDVRHRAVKDTGGYQAHENRPSYRALYFIMRTDRQTP